jgi:hypothetical protein
VPLCGTGNKMFEPRVHPSLADPAWCCCMPTTVEYEVECVDRLCSRDHTSTPENLHLQIEEICNVRSRWQRNKEQESLT